jgi:hypothetical protein
MSNIVAPIHTAPLGKATLRFFRSPLAGPDLPWHVHDDLAACLGLPRDARRQFRQRLISGPFKADVRVVATPDGIATIAPHFAAQGLIGAAIEAGLASAAFEDRYTAAAIAAFKAMTGDLPPMAALEMAIAAAKTSLETGS